MGGAVAPHILWSIAHEQGIKLPSKSYWEFYDLVRADPSRVHTLDEYLAILHTWTERIQSSPLAIERSVYEIIGKEYRSSRVTQIELRFNPMKRNLGGKADLDHIIHAALRGMDRATMEYGSRAGLIFCLAREFPVEMNEILVDKAIKYRARGVVGIDMAGSESNLPEVSSDAPRYERLFARARDEGLGTTCHCGETKQAGVDLVLAVLERLRPDRIGHGIRAVDSPRALDLLAQRGTVLEICPSSNLLTRAVDDLDELAAVIARLRASGVRFTVNTDGPYLIGTHLHGEIELLVNAGILSADDVATCVRTAREASFIR